VRPMLDPRTSPFVVVDVETTGLKPEQDRVCEVGAIRLVGGKEEGRFHRMIHPGMPMPAESTKVNKITDDMLKDAPRFDGIAAELRKFMSGSILVAQNAEFDVSFLNAEFLRAGMSRMAMPALDTILLARKVKPGLPTYNLDNLAYHFRVKFKERHRSIGDCEVTGQVFWQCVEALRPRSMEDLLKKGMIKA
jgi:DNA polymerase III epsilon subunit family exonuclease